MNTETVSLFDKEGIEDIIDRLEGTPENPQTAVNLLFVALLVAENEGVETDDLYEIFPKIRNKASKFHKVMVNMQDD